MSSNDIPNELRYSTSHEWIRLEDDGTATIGISHHAQSLLGDLVFVELPGVGNVVHSGDEVGVVESVKAASDLFVPIDGEVVEVNSLLEDEPSLVNTDPYGEGWIFKIQVTDTGQCDDLLNADDYEAVVSEEAH